LNNLKSVLNLKKNEIEDVVSNGVKCLIRTKKHICKGSYNGGHGNYFSNLSFGKYKNDPNNKEQGWEGPRTWKFIIKHIAATDKILSHQRPMRVLDIGCDTGFLRRILEGNVFSPEDVYYYGVDIEKSKVESAVFDLDNIESGAKGNNIPSLYLNYDVTCGLPFKDNSFDFIVSFEMTKYLETRETKKLFKEISRVLKSRGIFIYSTAGVCDNKNMMDKIAKLKGRMKSFFYLNELKQVLENNNLFLMKTYGSEAGYDSLKYNLRPEDRLNMLRMDSFMPKELVSAILGPFYPDTTPTKLFYISKGKIDLIDEVKNIFPKDKVVRLKHRGNSEIFLVGKKIVKYLPRCLLDKCLKIHTILKEQTNIKLPRVFEIRESKISENYILIMERIKGDTLKDIWKQLTVEKKEFVIRWMNSFLKQIHSVSLNQSNIPGYLRLFPGASDWKEEISNFCIDRLDEYKKKGLIGKKLYNFFLSTLSQNIDYIAFPDYVLLHGDFHSNNIMIDKDLNLTLLLDFEISIAGDKYLDLVVTGLFLEKRYQKMLFDLYETPKNFTRISKLYRLILFLNFLNHVDIKKEAEIMEFIEKDSPFFYCISK